MIEQNEWSREQCQTALNRMFKELALDVDRPYPRRPDFDHAYQGALADDELTRLRRQIDTGEIEADVLFVMRQGLARQDINPDDLPQPVQRWLEIGVARVLAERQGLFKFRLDEPLMPYCPSDPLFKTVQATITAEKSAIDPPLGPMLGDLVEKYKAAKRPVWTAKTWATNSQKLQYAVEFFGPDKFASTITASEINAYGEALLRLRRNHHVGAGKGFFERQTDDEAGRISPKTARLAFETCKAFFRWARAKAYLKENPALGIPMEMPKTKKSVVARRPFKEAELRVLFGSPAFTGCVSPYRRTKPGSLKVRDAKFWIPVLGYYTGLRLGEIVQLHLDDVDVIGPVPFITITDADSGEVGSGTEKHVKSEAGVRVVPLHPDVLALGFATFVQRRAKDHKARKRLFWEIGFGADGQPSSLFSKWFARLLDEIGLTDPTLVFHSFRHGMEDAYRNALTPQYVIDQIIGHDDGKTSQGYGEGVWIDVAYAATKAAKFPLSLLEVIAD